jgi:hypothetical protein
MLRLNKNCGGNSYELPLFTKAASFAKDHRWNQLPRVLYDSARLPASSLSDTVPLFYGHILYYNPRARTSGRSTYATVLPQAEGVFQLSFAQLWKVTNRSRVYLM